MAVDGWYYLHTNGSLIWKRNLGPDSMPEQDSPFVRRIWPMDLSNRTHAWILLTEAKAMGVDTNRINELAEKWGVNDNDARNFMEHNPFVIIDRFNKSQYAARFTGDDPLEQCKHYGKAQVGFGNSVLEALADLIKEPLLEKEKAGTLGKICPFPQ